jgi:DNA primase
LSRRPGASNEGQPGFLQRYPNGVGGPAFFPELRPEWLRTAVVGTPNGTTSDALVAADLAHVIWAVNLGCNGFHVWPSQADDQEHADELRIDLDPSPRVTFAMVREAAREVRRLFDENGVNAMSKTTEIAGSTSMSGSSRAGPPTRRAARPWP